MTLIIRIKIAIITNFSFVISSFRNYDTEIYAFSKRLGEEFNNDLLHQALTERSYIIREEERQKNVGIEQPTLNLSDNKELVSKGSDFIDDIVKRYLHTVLPKLPEEGIMYVYYKKYWPKTVKLLFCNFRGIHKYLTSIDILSHVSFHIGTSELILCAVSILYEYLFVNHNILYI